MWLTLERCLVKASSYYILGHTCSHMHTKTQYALCTYAHYAPSPTPTSSNTTALTHTYTLVYKKLILANTPIQKLVKHSAN